VIDIIQIYQKTEKNEEKKPINIKHRLQLKLQTSLKIPSTVNVDITVYSALSHSASNALGILSGQ